MGRLTRWGCDRRGRTAVPFALIRPVAGRDRAKARARRAEQAAVPEPAAELGLRLRGDDEEVAALLAADGVPDDFAETFEPGPPDPDLDRDEEPEFEPADFDDEPALQLAHVERAVELRAPASAFDAARYAAAVKRQAKGRPRSIETREPAPSRDECKRCGVPGFRGCEHQAAYVPEPLPAFMPRGAGQSKRMMVRSC